MNKQQEEQGFDTKGALLSLASGLNALILPTARDQSAAGQLAEYQKQKEQLRSANKTAAYFESIGRNDLAQLVRDRAISGRDAFSTYTQEQAAARSLEAQKAATAEDRAFQKEMFGMRTQADINKQGITFQNQKDLAAYEADLASQNPKDATAIQEYKLALSQGYTGSYIDFKDRLKRDPQMGQIPEGYKLVTKTLDDGSVEYTYEPIKGSPAYQKAQEAAQKKESRAETRETMTNTILREAQKARELIGNWSTGAGAFLLQGLPTTDARALAGHVRSLQAQATIETLNAMRQESPTGGALGNVTNQENAMLAAKAGLLDPMSKPEVFKQQLDDYELTLLQIVHGSEEGLKRFNEGRSGGGSNPKRLKFDSQGNVVE